MELKEAPMPALRKGRDLRAGTTRLLIALTCILLAVAHGFVDACRAENAMKTRTLRVVFDDLHGQTFGNADWTPDAAYSSFADDLRHELNASIATTSGCNAGNRITPEMLESCDVLIIPEPNTRLSHEEIDCIHSFVESGCGLFLISDHGGSDRNFDGWDACMILNELTHGWGLLFTGSDHSEAPIRLESASGHPALAGVGRLGAWAATSILIDPENTAIRSIATFSESREPYIAAGSAGKGRILAIGDSSPFDDGTGAEDKSRHSAYLSWLYDHRRFVVQSVAWLGGRPMQSEMANPIPLPVFRADRCRELDGHSVLIIDCAHGSNESDIMSRFIGDLQKNLRMQVLVNLDPIRSLPRGAVLLISNPNLAFSDSEMKYLRKWIRRRGGKALLSVNSARVPLSGLQNADQLLANLGSRLSFTGDEIVDEQNNTGKPWSIVAREIDIEGVDPIRSAVFWSATSIRVDGENDRAISIVAKVSDTAGVARGKRDTERVRGAREEMSRVVAAVERTGRGAICLLGAPTMTNYQYFSMDDRRKLDPLLWDHDTDRFNQSLVLYLKEL